MMVVEVTNRFVFLYVAIFLPLTVSSLKCYHCLSSTSMEDCSKNSKKLTCPEVADSCAKISTEVMSDHFAFKSYSYGCATQTMCHDAEEQLKACEKFNQGGYQAKCDIACCKGDLCSPLVHVPDVSRSFSAALMPSLLLVVPAVIFTLTSYFKLF